MHRLRTGRWAYGRRGSDLIETQAQRYGTQSFGADDCSPLLQDLRTLIDEGVEIARNRGVNRDERSGSGPVWEMEFGSVGPAVHRTLEIGGESKSFACRLDVLPFPKILYEPFGLGTRNLVLGIVPEIDDVLGLGVVVDDAPKPITESVLQVGT